MNGATDPLPPFVPPPEPDSAPPPRTHVIPPPALEAQGDDINTAQTVRAGSPESQALEDEPPLPPSTRIAGRYLIVHELGRGGMGIVYRALDQGLGRQVALKVIQRHLLQDPDLHGRFLEEARLTARLQHPAIVPVFDVGTTEEGLVFYTMRLVEGRNLADVANDGWTLDGHSPGRSTLFRLLEVLVQACRALGYAHDRGLVHRDMKPSNVMVGRFGEVHVLDWGLAKAVGWTPERADRALLEALGDDVPLTTGSDTRTGSVVGTPAYMSPEQACGQPLDTRCDVYALGGVLYTLLTGKLPHEGTTSEVLWRVTWGTPPPAPSVHRADVPAALDAICLRALAHSRDDRYRDGAELAGALEDYLQGRPLVAVRPEDAEFLRTYRPTEFRRPSVTVDVVVLHAPPGATPWALLHRRSNSPFKGRWALPGSFVRLEDDLETAARRTLWREMGFGAPDLALEQLGAFGDPARDPRTRVITVAFLCVLEDPEAPEPITAEDQADESAWFEVFPDGPHAVTLRGHDGAEHEPAFDHGAILAAALKRWKARA